MLPGFLFPETTVDQNGSGEPFEIGENGGMALLSLGISHADEQQSLDLKIMGSTDGEEWLEEPVRDFSQKFYAGVYQILCDLSATPDVKYLRVDYTVARWGVGIKTPNFKFYVFAEPFAERKSA